MKSFSAKNKILILCSVWLVLSASMFLFFFKILDVENQKTLISMGDDRTTLVNLQNEDKSFKQAQSDLNEISSGAYQPNNFFSKDVTFVTEIQTLDNLAAKYNVVMELSGVSGTINTLPPAPTATALAIVPYSLSLTGNLTQVVNFIENMENLNFVTNINAVSVSSSGQNLVTASLSANFYLSR